MADPNGRDDNAARHIAVPAADAAALAEEGNAPPAVPLQPVATEPMRRVAHESELNAENELDKEFARDRDSLSEAEEEEEVDADDFKAHSSGDSSSGDPEKKRAPLNRIQSTATTATNASSLYEPTPVATLEQPAKGSWTRWLLFKHRTPPAIPRDRTVSPEYGAGWFSQISFQWINPLMVKGYQRPLEYTDIWTVNPNRSAEVLSEKLERSFRQRVERGDKRPLLGAMYETLKFEFILGGICQLTSNIGQVMNPFLLRYLLYFSQESYYAHQNGTEGPPIGQGVGYVIGLVLILMLQNTCANQMMYRGMINGGQARAILISLIFDKAMKISGRAKAGGKPADEEPSDAFKATQEDKKRQAEKRSFVRFWQKKKPQQEDTAEQQKGSSEILGDGQGYSNGRIINLMSVDTYRIDQASGMFHLIWTGPIALIITLILLLIVLRESALAGYGFILILTPLLGKAIGSLISRRKGVNKITDQRVSLTQEVLSSVRFVKYFGWETSFLDRIGNIRSQEIRAIQWILAIRNGINAISMSVPVFAAMLGFITFSYAGGSNSFNAANIFSSLALFNSIRIPLNMLPLVIGQVSDAVSSVARIQEFLLAEDEKEATVWDVDAKQAIEVTNASFTWERTPTKGPNEGTDASKNAKQIKAQAKADKKARRQSKRNSKDLEKQTADTAAEVTEQQRIFTINDLSFSVGRDELVAVIGGVGSGKTSLLSALAGDMRKTDGEVKLGARRAFCPQSAWIQNATVRKNILFGRDYDRKWYNEVVDACALRTDLEILPSGDMTEIGEKGITVSGGQKQRLNIARAIYFDADIILMDDPLSAVDAHVGRHIMDNAICGLLKDKCRVLATHQLWVLNRVDRIIWMDEGKIQAIGTYDELMATNDAFAELIAANDQEERKEQQENANEDEVEDEKKVAQKKKGKKPGAALMQAEERATESVSLGVYVAYIKASGSILVLPLIFLLLVLAQGSNIVTSLWLSWWTSGKFGYSREVYVGVYAAFGVVQALLMFLFSVALSVFGTQASKVMLHRALTRVLRAPMSFFDTTPLGRITNRFSKDIDTMDNVLTDNMRFFLITMAMIVSVFILIIAYYYYFIIALAPLAVLFVFAANFYRSSAREVKRHESVLRSHVFARFSEAVTGVPTIRAYGLQSAFSKVIRETVDDMNSAYFLTFANQRWLSARLDMIGNILVFVVGILVVTSRVSIDPSTAGLVLSYILTIVMMIQFTIRQLAEVENNMNSTERIHHYGVNLDEEPPLHLPNPKVTPEWPQTGAIEFDNVEMRYRAGLPLVLKGLNLDVKGGERIGVVGRTGAGKSSIMSTLFRLVELSGGSIKIDGVDIATVGLEDLRQRLAIIPQDPTLFRGTVRSNLDPFGRYGDLELWNALRAADLVGEAPPGTRESDASEGRTSPGEDEKAPQEARSGAVTSSKGRITLDTAVEEEGANFSLGQRQLMALARALVRGSRVIVCDEATSSVDMATDERIQRTMAMGFAGKTLLCIAHRLRTILAYDRIVVMDQGAIAECAAPLALYDAGGIFRSMCDRSSIRRKDIPGGADGGA